MNLFVSAITALSLSGSLAFAQAPEAPSGPPPEVEDDRPAPPSRGPGDDVAKDEWRMHHPQNRERGARYRIETGRTTIDLRCPDNEPAKDCADLLLQVLDRLQGDRSEDEDRRDYDRDRSGIRG